MKRLLHRYIWQNLPRELRRSLLFKATELLAPRAKTDIPAAEPIIIAGYLSSASGLGESARLVHDALAASGIDVRGHDLSPAMMQPSDLKGWSCRPANPVAGAGTIILFVNAPLVAMALTRMPRALISGKRIIGYWAWELEKVPSEWRNGARYVHEIWGPSSFCTRAFAEVAGGRDINVVWLPVASRSQIKLPDPSLATERPFTVLVAFNMASSFARKNPLAAVAAFMSAFGDSDAARLILRVINPAVYADGLRSLQRATEGRRNIELQTQVLSVAELDRLYANIDVYLALHRSEGFGLGIAEAMLRGLPTVATGWSGSTDFHTEATGFPVAYDLVPAADPQGEYNHPDLVWADANVVDAAAKLRLLAEDPTLRKGIGVQARDSVSKMLGQKAFAARMQQLLKLPPNRSDGDLGHHQAWAPGVHKP